MLLGDQFAEVLIKDGKAVQLDRFRLGDLLALAVLFVGAQLEDDLVAAGDEGLDLFGLEKVNEVGIDQFLLLLPAEHRKNRRGEDHQDQNIKADLSLSVAFRFQAWVTSYLSTLACLCGVL